MFYTKIKYIYENNRNIVYYDILCNNIIFIITLHNYLYNVCINKYNTII